MANSTDPTAGRSLRQRFRLGVGHAVEGMAIVEGGRVVCVNDRLREILGYSSSELTRMTDLDLAVPEERKRLRQAVQELQRKRLPLEQSEFWALHKDGSQRYIRNQYLRGPDADGVARLVVLTTDLTEQQGAQQAAAPQELPGPVPPQRASAEQEAFLGQIIDASPTLVYVKDWEGRFVMVNRRYAESFGREPKDFVGKSNQEMDWPEDLVKEGPARGIWGVWAEEQEIMASDQTKLMPREWLWLGGRWCLMSTVKVPLHDAEGRVSGLVGFAQDAAEPERPSAQAEVLYEVSKALAAASNPEEMLRAFAGPSMKTGAHVAILMYLDPDAEGQPKWAKVVAVIGETTTPIGARFHVLDSSQAALLAAGTEQPLLIGDIRLPHHALNEAVRRDMQSIDAQAFAILPLRVGEQWLGVVTLAWPEARQFHSEEKRLYTLMGAQLAMAIDNANSIAEAQAAAARERRVRNITERIHRAADAQIIMRSALRELSQMLGTSKAVIRLGTRAQLEAELAESSSGHE